MVFSAPIAIGSLAWGTPVNDSLLDLDSRIKALNLGTSSMASDHNLLSWTFDPATNLGSAALTSGVIQMMKIFLREPATVTNLIVSVSSAGAGLTAGQNLAALYDAGGNRLGITVDQSASWTSTGAKTMPMTAPVVNPAGAYYIALLSNGATPAGFARGSQLSSGPTTVNIGLTATTARYATSGVGQTTLPVTITMGARTTSAIAHWGAIS